MDGREAYSDVRMDAESRARWRGMFVPCSLPLSISLLNSPSCAASPPLAYPRHPSCHRHMALCFYTVQYLCAIPPDRLDGLFYVILNIKVHILHIAVATLETL